MKKNYYLLLALSILLLGSCTRSDTASENEAVHAEAVALDYFQLKIYNFETADQETMLDNYFQDGLIPALHRTGIQNVGVFKPIEELNEDTDYMMVLIPLNSLEQFESLPDLLLDDSEYVSQAESYIEAPHDNPPYSRIENIILRSFISTPKMGLPELSTPRSGRVYELRSYEAATEKLYNLKVEMFNEGETDIFYDLDFNPVFFGEVLSSANMPHLMYMTAHADTSAQTANWNAFGEHPEWERMRNMERYQNTVSKITRYLLYPASYSDF